jgi:hypothetical protein
VTSFHLRELDPRLLRRRVGGRARRFRRPDERRRWPSLS